MRPVRTSAPNLLRNRSCFLALSYSILETARQCSEGGCTALADEQRSVKIVETNANNVAPVMLVRSAYSRPPYIGLSPQSPLYPPIKTANDTSSQCKADDNCSRRLFKWVIHTSFQNMRSHALRPYTRTRVAAQTTLEWLIARSSARNWLSGPIKEGPPEHEGIRTNGLLHLHRLRHAARRERPPARSLRELRRGAAIYSPTRSNVDHA